jgi:hypothetical protein
MNKNLSSDIELRFTMRVPIKKGGPEVVPAKIFVPIAAGILYWITYKHGLLDQTAILIGCAVVPVSVFVFMRGLRPLILFANGNISITNTIGPSAKLITKNEVNSYAQLPHGVIVFCGEGQKVLGGVRPDSFKNGDIFKQWFGLHYSGVPKIELDPKKGMLRPEKQPFGSFKFFVVAGILLLLVAYNIYLAVSGSSY